MLGRARSDSAA